MHLIQFVCVWIYWWPYLMLVAAEHIIINYWWSWLRFPVVSNVCHDWKDATLSGSKTHAKLLET